MLDTTTKKRIDDCRDILVGKLPDPKAQIEQITIGLIYKFMDDMDKEAVELGGTAKFFSGDFSKYSWDSLFDTKVTATEMLDLYSQAIVSMDKNPNIPELFRNIFKNAYLPYRDPETLKLFLKTIGEFEYTHSEKLGDAFEYLLSVMGSQGDAGQFRTPRHIIDFLVACVDPGKTDTILDPACGTAGFLISAFKHIMGKAETGRGLSGAEGLTPAERKRLIKNFVGYDISPDMVRLSLVNLYLHGFPDPHIWEYDSLSSEERWNESFDVVLANPPFMSPKGGIRPHKKFTISSNRSEVLFVDYIAEHLNPKGRAGIIVPEGVIFQSGKAYKDLRKMLVDHYLYAVVSLPAGVFNPYSGVKTSILLLDKTLAKKTKDILFVKIDNDGYGLGAQRNAIKGGQLEEAVTVLAEFKAGTFLESQAERSRSLAHAVPKTELAKNGDYNLSGERYKSIIEINSDYKLVEISQICDNLFAGGDAPKEYSKTITKIFNIPIYSNGVGEKSLYGYTNKGRVEEDAVTISARGTIGYPMVRKAPFLPIVRLIVAVPNKSIVNINYLKLALDSIEIYRNGNSIPQLTVPMIREEKIPLPPLPIQEAIVIEIEGYQKIIDGAKAVVANYRPHINIDPDWEMVELGEVCEIRGGLERAIDKSLPYIGADSIQSNTGQLIKKMTADEQAVNGPVYKFSGRNILYSKIRPYLNKVTLSDFEGYCSSDMYPLGPSDRVMIQYLFYFLLSENFNNAIKGFYNRASIPKINRKQLFSVRLPLPPLETQQQIVAQIENEQALVNANKELIALFEQKIKDRIAKVWGASTPLSTEASTALSTEASTALSTEASTELDSARSRPLSAGV